MNFIIIFGVVVFLELLKLLLNKLHITLSSTVWLFINTSVSSVVGIIYNRPSTLTAGISIAVTYTGISTVIYKYLKIGASAIKKYIAEASDNNKLIKIFKIVGIVLGVILVGWLVVTFKVNIGKLFGRKNLPQAILNGKGKVVGTKVEVVTDKNPLRDMGVVKLSDGSKVNLPKGVKDTDVENVTITNLGVYNVEKKHTKLTNLFD